MTGRVTLAGAGPGDPDLLTVKALRAIAAADVILHDSLVGPDILALARPETLRRETGKRCGRRSTAQDEINRLMLHHARAGAHVVRLKGGDPMLFGRADEEVEVLRQHRIPYEVIPGVTAASAAAAAVPQSTQTIRPAPRAASERSAGAFGP
jgi:siroheme synthase